MKCREEEMRPALKKEEEEGAAVAKEIAQLVKCCLASVKAWGQSSEHTFRKSSGCGSTYIIHTLYTERLRGPRTLPLTGFFLQAEFKVQETPLGY